MLLVKLSQTPFFLMNERNSYEWKSLHTIYQDKSISSDDNWFTDFDNSVKIVYKRLYTVLLKVVL